MPNSLPTPSTAGAPRGVAPQEEASRRNRLESGALLSKLPDMPAPRKRDDGGSGDAQDAGGVPGSKALRPPTLPNVSDARALGGDAARGAVGGDAAAAASAANALASGDTDAMAQAGVQAIDNMLWKTIWEDFTGLSLLGVNITGLMGAADEWPIWKKIALIVLDIAAVLFLVVTTTFTLVNLCLWNVACSAILVGGAMLSVIRDSMPGFLKGFF
ncbi:MAG: hypothetical protein RLZZ324_786 [Candidatus Parcubacteria bacterium]|jgi:hypothetical protein